MVLREGHEQGILVGFEFAILNRHLSESKRVCTALSRTSEDRGNTMRTLGETAPGISEQASGEAVAHHVATLPLSRCMDNPPVHQFQHELESFIWSIFFIQNGFRYGRRTLNPDLENWYTQDWKSIKSIKRGFLEGEDCVTSASRFAESLGVDPLPLMACSRSLAEMLLNPTFEQLDAARILSTLQKARDDYERINQ